MRSNRTRPAGRRLGANPAPPGGLSVRSTSSGALRASRIVPGAFGGMPGLVTTLGGGSVTRWSPPRQKVAAETQLATTGPNPDEPDEGEADDGEP